MIGGGGTVYYPFGGPDLLHVSAMFPQARNYALMGLESVGEVPPLESLPPEEVLGALESFRQRAREALTPARQELAAWYRNFFRKKKGPAKATHMVLSLVANPETPQPQWQFTWTPGMYSRYQLFTPSQPLPATTILPSDWSATASASASMAVTAIPSPASASAYAPPPAYASTTRAGPCARTRSST